jgi:hypothetical protein
LTKDKAIGYSIEIATICNAPTLIPGEISMAEFVRPKKVLIALPDKMLEQVDSVAVAEHRTRSDLIREALRRYLLNFKREQTPGSIVNQLKEQIYSV